MDLTVLIDPKLDLPRLSQVLDEMGHAGRVHTIRGWGKQKQAKIFEAASGFKKIGLDHFVPASVGPLVEVVHELHNTLPLFSNSQKRFCKPGGREGEGQPNELWGYNHQSISGVIGPGYFLTRPSETDGEVVFDYRQVPPDRVPSWPPILSNTERLGRFVYAGMMDYVRGISNHISIGRAEKGRKMLDAWFVLCRQDPG